jgi:virulence-associated protein VagC
MSDIAKIFWSGRSQAVRLPKEYRFDGTEVTIRREGSRVILTPTPMDYGQDDIGRDVSRGIEELRMLIAAGEDEAGDAEWDVAEVKRRAGQAFASDRED